MRIARLGEEIDQVTDSDHELSLNILHLTFK